MPNKTWDDVCGIKDAIVKNIGYNANLEYRVNFEAHLMIAKADEKIGDWLNVPVKRLIFHYEAVQNPNGVLEKIKNAGKEAGIAINPETSIKVLGNIEKKLLDSVLVMTVDPGFAGQKFQRDPLFKISFIKSHWDKIQVGVDGGVNFKTTRWVKEAGPDYAAAGSCIWSDKNPKLAYLQLKKALN